MKQVISYTSLFILFVILIFSCSPFEPGESTTGGKTIACEFFYRSSGGSSFEPALEITFQQGTEQKEHQFESMAFHARFQDDQFEGRALSIAVTNLETGAEISRQLYQFDPQSPTKNQFIGGHGFTGLQYVFHPDSDAEMQYFCGVE